MTQEEKNEIICQTLTAVEVAILRVRDHRLVNISDNSTVMDAIAKELCNIRQQRENK